MIPRCLKHPESSRLVGMVAVGATPRTHPRSPLWRRSARADAEGGCAVWRHFRPGRRCAMIPGGSDIYKPQSSVLCIRERRGFTCVHTTPLSIHTYDFTPLGVNRRMHGVNTSDAATFLHGQGAKLQILDVGTTRNCRKTSIWSKMAPYRAPTLGACSR